MPISACSNFRLDTVWTADERHLYDLICRRFIGDFLPNCQFSTTTILGACGGTKFKATGKKILSYGWKLAYNNAPNADENNNNSKAWSSLT